MTKTTGMQPLRRCLSESNGQDQRQKERIRSKSLQFEPTFSIATKNKEKVGTEKISVNFHTYLILAIACLVLDAAELRKCTLCANCKNNKKNSHQKSKDQEAQTIRVKSLMNDCLNELDQDDSEKHLKNIQGYHLANTRVSLQKLFPFLYEDYFNCVNLVHRTIIKAFPLFDCSSNFEEYVQKELNSAQFINPLNSAPLERNPHSMNMEMIRISTFSNFPQTTSVSTVRLAKEGFYYTGEGDKVACFACGLHRDGWRAADDPREIHIRLSPNCPFLNSCQSENVPIQEGENIGSSQMEIQPRGDSGESTSGHVIQTGEGNILQNSTLSMSNNEIRLRENTGYSVPTYSASNSSQQEDEFNLKSLERQERERPLQRSRALQEKINVFLRSLDPLGINFDRPKYPAYAVVATRVSSFNDWPSSITQTPRDLALAGFLYVGYGDYTRCFFCGGGLRNWEPGDDPWIEHARWFPKCAFLRQNKGDEFVALVQIEHNETEASEEAMNAEEGATSTRCRSNNKSTGTEEKNTTASDIFDLVSVQSILEMGYTRQAVKEAFDLLRMTKHVEEISGEDLIDVILSKEENSTRPDIQSATRNSEPKLLEGNDTGHTNESTKKEDSSNIGSTSGAKDSPSTIGSLDCSNNSLSSFSIEDTKSLIEENRKLKDLRLCKICLENDASIAMLPCGHLCCCLDCAPAMRKCPICRQFVKGTVRTWLV